MKNTCLYDIREIMTVKFIIIYVFTDISRERPVKVRDKQFLF